MSLYYAATSEEPKRKKSAALAKTPASEPKCSKRMKRADPAEAANSEPKWPKRFEA